MIADATATLALAKTVNVRRSNMPAHSGKKKPMGKKPKKNGKKKRKGLTAKQKKLPPALQKAILKKMRRG